MDCSACAVLYIDRRARAAETLNSSNVKDYEGLLGEEDADHNIRTLLSIFNQVFVCPDGISCLSKVSQLDEPNNANPIIVLIDMPHDDVISARKASWDARSPSPTTLRRPKVERNEPSDLYGMHLLSYLASEVQQRVRSSLILPVAMLGTDVDLLAEPMRMSRYLDAGAVDVLSAPLTTDRMQGLAVHAYRRFKEASREDSSFVLAKRNRKLSWVGIDEERPYAYLREVMVSGLMNGICNPESVGDSIDPSELDISPEQKSAIAAAVGTWSFSAHAFNCDELLFAALTMLEHALQMPELEKWRKTTGKSLPNELTTFLMACRKAYNDFVLYHNFRHIVDVLQAVFYFLLQIGILPPYPTGRHPSRIRLAPVATLLQPFDALTLLVSAIGHDVGHPGVNNAFLVALNAPLAQLYNDRSVLEAFHCAAYSQILRRYWPEAFADIPMRKLMINSILATDMGLHFKYMVDMGNLQEKLAANDDTIEGWTPKALEETRDLCCGLLIKCADISNVARNYDVAAQWADILTDEFSNQGAMEKELNLPTCLFGGPPDRGDAVKMAESQIGFMNIFAGPLFEGISDILPAMRFSVAELEANRSTWEKKIEIERTRRGSLLRHSVGTAASPKTRSQSVVREDEESKSVEAIPPLPMDRDSFIGHSRSAHSIGELPKYLLDATARTQSDNLLASERRIRNPSLSSNSPIKSHRKPSNSGSIHAQFPLPFAHPHSGSRRSSKDAALEHLDQLHLNNLSRLESHSFDSTRRGSADASLTTIVVRSQTPQNKQDAASLNKTPSPLKHNQLSSSSSQVGQESGRSSLPSSQSNETSNTAATTTIPRSPSTKASSLTDEEIGVKQSSEPPPILSTENPFLNPNTGPDLDAVVQRHTASAPDVLGAEATRRSKTSLVSQVTRENSEEADDPRLGAHQRDLRESRSRSRLRGLRFWRKRWKSPGSSVEVDGSP